MEVFEVRSAWIRYGGGIGLVLLAVAACQCARSPSGRPPGRGDWWMLGGDAQHTGRSTHLAPRHPVIKWDVDLDAFELTCPVMASDGTIYVGAAIVASRPEGMDGRLAAITPQGRVRWQYKPGAAVRSTPAVGADGTVYFGSDDKRFYALTPRGRRKWRFTTTAMIQSSPAIAPEGTVCFTAGIHLYALHPDGSVKWDVKTEGVAGTCSPVLGRDGTVYVACGMHDVYAYRADGTLKWARDVELGTVTYLALRDDDVLLVQHYVGAHDELLAVSPDGEVMWRYGGVSRLGGVALAADSTVYTATERLQPLAVDRDGNELWHRQLGAGECVWGLGLVDQAGILCLGTMDVDPNRPPIPFVGHVYALSPAGDVLWEVALPHWAQPPPALGADGVLYVPCNDGHLYAIGEAPTAKDDEGSRAADSEGAHL